MPSEILIFFGVSHTLLLIIKVYLSAHKCMNIRASANKIQYFHTSVYFHVPHVISYFKQIFASQSTLKVLPDLNKETIFITTLEKMHIIRGRSQMGSLRSERHFLHFRNNLSNWVLKNYTKGLQPGFPHSARISCPNFKKITKIKEKDHLCSLPKLLQRCPLIQNKNIILIMESKTGK